jgi:hypothetical protein
MRQRKIHIQLVRAAVHMFAAKAIRGPRGPINKKREAYQQAAEDGGILALPENAQFFPSV